MAPGVINIQRDNPDQFYRYRMEPLQTKIEGKGNGIKTVIVNLPSVAQSLERPRKWIIKYFGFELGATTPEDKKNDRWIINGAHEAAKLQDLLDGFIKKFVLCPACRNPETKFELDASGNGFKFDCKACGRQSPVGTANRFTGFISKDLNEERKKKQIADKAAKKAAKKARQNGTADDAPEEAGEKDKNGDDGGASSPHEDESAVEDPELAKLRAEVAQVEISAAKNNDEEETWAMDVTQEGAEARAAQLSGEFADKFSIKRGGGSAFDTLGFWINEQNEALGGISNVTSESILEKIEELEIEGEKKTVNVLGRTLFDENIVKQIPGRAKLLKQVIDKDEMLEGSLLSGIERLLMTMRKVHPKILEKTQEIFYLLYDLEVVTEDVFVEWAQKGPNESSRSEGKIQASKEFYKHVNKFIEWLSQASEEEDSDEEE